VALATFLLAYSFNYFFNGSFNYESVSYASSHLNVNTVELSSIQTPPNTIHFYFWPGSRSCFKLDTALTLWQKSHPETIIKRIPLVFRPKWRLLAKTWLVAESLKFDETFLDKLYQYLHTEKLKITTIPELKAFLALNQIDSEPFLHQFYSYAINEQLKLLQSQSRKLPISGVPTIIKDKWLIDASLASTTKQMLTILEDH